MKTTKNFQFKIFKLRKLKKEVSGGCRRRTPDKGRLSQERKALLRHPQSTIITTPIWLWAPLNIKNQRPIILSFIDMKKLIASIT